MTDLKRRRRPHKGFKKNQRPVQRLEEFTLAVTQYGAAMHKYRLIGKKGEGTFSEVLKAQCIKDGKSTAIKCMKNHFDSLDQARARTAHMLTLAAVAGGQRARAEAGRVCGHAAAFAARKRRLSASSWLGGRAWSPGNSRIKRSSSSCSRETQPCRFSLAASASAAILRCLAAERADPVSRR